MSDALSTDLVDVPVYRHDCDRCTFLGRWEDYDLYHCYQGMVMPTVIARYGDDGAQYLSGLPLAGRVEALGEATRRAAERGLQVKP